MKLDMVERVMYHVAKASTFDLDRDEGHLNNILIEVCIKIKINVLGQFLIFKSVNTLVCVQCG